MTQKLEKTNKLQNAKPHALQETGNFPTVQNLLENVQNRQENNSYRQDNSNKEIDFV
jgi:hypothetical protein